MDPSEPLLPNTHTAPQRYTGSEPLTPVPQNKWRTKTWTLVLAAVLLVSALAMLLKRQTWTHMAPQPLVSFQGFQVDSLDQNGVSGYAHVSVDMEKPNSEIAAHLATLMGCLVVCPEGLSIKTLDENRTEQRLADLELAPFQVQPGPGSHMKLTVHTRIHNFSNYETLALAANTFLAGAPLSVAVDGMASVHKLLGSRLLVALGRFPVHWSHSVQLGKENSFLDLLEMTEAHLQQSSPSSLHTSLLLSVAIHQGFPVSSAIPSLNWTVSLAACDKPVHVCDLETGPLTLDINERPHLTGVASIADLAKLNTPCSSGHATYAQWALNRYLTNQSLALRIQGNPHHRAPAWMAKYMAQTSFIWTYPGRSIHDSLVEKVRVSSVRVNMGVTAPSLSARVQIQIQLPRPLTLSQSAGLNLHKAKGMVLIVWHNTQVAHMLLDKWAPCTLQLEPRARSKTVLVDMFLSHAPIVIDNEMEFASLSRQIAVQGQARVHIKALCDTELETPLCTIPLQKIPFQGNVLVQY